MPPNSSPNVPSDRAVGTPPPDNGSTSSPAFDLLKEGRGVATSTRGPTGLQDLSIVGATIDATPAFNPGDSVSYQNMPGWTYLGKDAAGKLIIRHGSAEDDLRISVDASELSAPRLPLVDRERQAAKDALQALKDARKDLPRDLLDRLQKQLEDSDLPGGKSLTQITKMLEQLKDRTVNATDAKGTLADIAARLNLSKSFATFEKTAETKGIPADVVDRLRTDVENRLKSQTSTLPPEGVEMLRSVQKVLDQLNDPRIPKDKERMEVLNDLLKLTGEHPDRVIPLERVLDPSCKIESLKHWAQLVQQTADEQRPAAGTPGDQKEFDVGRDLERALAQKDLQIDGKAGKWVYAPGAKDSPADGAGVDGEFINLQTGEVVFADPSMNIDKKQEKGKDRWVLDTRDISTIRGPRTRNMDFSNMDQVRDLAKEFMEVNPVGQKNSRGRVPVLNVSDFASQVGVPDGVHITHPSFRNVTSQREADDIATTENRPGTKTSYGELQQFIKDVAKHLQDDTADPHREAWQHLLSRAQDSAGTRAEQQMIWDMVKNRLADAASIRATGTEHNLPEPKIFRMAPGTNSSGYLEIKFKEPVPGSKTETGNFRASVAQDVYDKDGHPAGTKTFAVQVSRLRVYPDGSIVAVAYNGEIDRSTGLPKEIDLNMGKIKDVIGEMKQEAPPPGVSVQDWQKTLDTMQTNTFETDSINLTDGRYDPKGQPTKMDWSNEKHVTAFFKKYPALDYIGELAQSGTALREAATKARGAGAEFADKLFSDAQCEKFIEAMKKQGTEPGARKVDLAVQYGWGTCEFLKGNADLCKALGLDPAKLDPLEGAEIKFGTEPGVSVDSANNKIVITLPERLGNDTHNTPAMEREIWRLLVEKTAEKGKIEYSLDGKTKRTTGLPYDQDRVNELIEATSNKLYKDKRYENLPEQDAKDAAAAFQRTEPLAQRPQIDRFLAEADQSISAEWTRNRSSQNLSDHAIAEARAERLTKFIAQYYRIKATDVDGHDTLANLKVEVAEPGDKPGLIYKDRSGNEFDPVASKNGELIDVQGNRLKLTDATIIFRAPEGLFADPKLLLQEVYCKGLLAVRQDGSQSERGEARGLNHNQTEHADGLVETATRTEFNSTQRRVDNVNLTKGATAESGRIGDAFFVSRLNALTELRRSEISVDGGIARFRGRSIDLIDAATKGIDDLNKQLEDLRKQADKEKDAAEKTRLTQRADEMERRIKEYETARDAASTNGDFGGLAKVFKNEFPEQLAREELRLRDTPDAPKGGGVTGCVYLFAALLPLFCSAAASAAERRPTYTPPIPIYGQ